MAEKETKDEELNDSTENNSFVDENDAFPEKEEDDSKSSRKHLFLRVLSRTFPIIFIGIFASFLTNSFLLGDKYVEKESINSEISTLIKNGAGLRAVKFHYEHRKAVKRDILFSIKHDLSLYYNYEIALSEILEKIRTEQFLKGNLDEGFMAKLDGIIKEYTESNPFDKLEAGQKDLFENIRVKLGDSYSVVSDDINKLSDELNNKNKLVNEYLSDSQTSLVVSIVSAFIAVVLAGVQMWQSRSKPVFENLYAPRSIIKAEYVSENDDGDRVRTVRYSDGRVMEKVYGKDGRIITRRSVYS